MRYSVMEHPQSSERSTSRFFSSALRRRVTVDHFPEALFGLLPLGLRPLTAPLPPLHDGLRLLHGVVPPALDHVHDGGIPTAVPRPRLGIFALEQATVEPAAGGALALPRDDPDLVHGQNLPQISFGSDPVSRKGKPENLFFAGSFRFRGILSPGDEPRIAGHDQNLPAGNFPGPSTACGHPPPSGSPGDVMTPWWHSGGNLVGNGSPQGAETDRRAMASSIPFVPGNRSSRTSRDGS